MRYGSAPRLKRDLIALAVVSVVYLGVSTLVTNSYYQLIMTLVPIWALFGVSWNILSGYGGQLSFGHASFFGIGAYVVTLTLVYWNLTPWLGIPIGMIVAAIAAILIGLPTFRLRGHYFALSMLAYPLAILYFLQYLGFQEMSLPMHRDRPVEFSAVRQSALLHAGRRLLPDRRHLRLHAGGEFPLRPRPSGDPPKRTGGRGSRDKRPPVENARPWSCPA